MGDTNEQETQDLSTTCRNKNVDHHCSNSMVIINFFLCELGWLRLGLVTIGYIGLGWVRHISEELFRTKQYHTAGSA